MKPIILLLVLISAGLTTAAQDTSDWKTYSSVEGQFSVLLPQSPEVHSLPLTHPSGITILAKMFIVVGDDIEKPTLIISYTDYPTDLPESFLDAARDGALKRAKATLVREEKISLSGYPGLEVKATGEPGTIQFRIFLVGHRMYFVAYTWPKGADRTLATKNAAIYFASFKLNEAKNLARGRQ